MANSSVLKINGIDVPHLVLEDEWSADHRGSVVQSCLKLVLKKDDSALAVIDLKGRLTYQVLRDGNVVRRFAGFITYAEEASLGYEVSCNDPSQLLQETPVAGGFGRGILPAEAVYYLVKEVTPDGTDAKYFSISNRQTLDDTFLLKAVRTFVYIVPVNGCVLKSSQIQLSSDAWMYSSSQQPDELKIERLIKDRDAKHWTENRTRIIIYVEAKDFLEAFFKGREELSRILDVMSFGSNFGTPTFEHNAAHHFHKFERKRVLVSINETPWAYVRDTLGADRYWLNWNAPHRSNKPFELIHGDPLLLFYNVFKPLEGNSDKLNKKQRALLNAVHALRQARQAEYVGDGLSHIWRCVEYLVYGYKVEPLFTNVECKALIDAATAEIESKDSQDLSDEDINHLVHQKKRIADVLNGLNSFSLRTKWNSFCRAHNIQLPIEDENFIWNLRKIRNHDQHGRVTNVSRADLERAATMLEKVLVVAVSSEM